MLGTWRKIPELYTTNGSHYLKSKRKVQLLGGVCFPVWKKWSCSDIVKEKQLYLVTEKDLMTIQNS